jgi:hypothetical protein
MLLPAMPLCTPLAAKGNADVEGMHALVAILLGVFVDQ